MGSQIVDNGQYCLIVFEGLIFARSDVVVNNNGQWILMGFCFIVHIFRVVNCCHCSHFDEAR